MATYGVAALGGLDDPARRAIFGLPTTRPITVGELLTNRLPVSRPAVSQQVKVLKAAGPVVDVAVGTCGTRRTGSCTWQLQGDWQYGPDAAKAGEVEIRFVAEGPDRTRVQVEHRHFERHGAGADSVRDGVSSPNGYDYCLGRHVALLGAA